MAFWVLRTAESDARKHTFASKQAALDFAGSPELLSIPLVDLSENGKIVLGGPALHHAVHEHYEAKVQR